MHNSFAARVTTDIHIKKMVIHTFTFFHYRQQFKKLILSNAQDKGWAVEPGVKNGRRGYVGVKLARVRRCEPGFEFGGKRMLTNIETHMKLNPPLVPLTLES